MNNETNTKTNPEELTFKKVEVPEYEYTYWRGHEEGDQIIGRLTHANKRGSGPFDHGTYEIDGLNGEKYLLCTDSIFDNKMSQLEVGNIVKIVYQGFIQTGWDGEGYNDYTVYIAETEE